MISVGLPKVTLGEVRLRTISLGAKRGAYTPKQPTITLPKYELTCEHNEFVKNTKYTIVVKQTQVASEVMDVQVLCDGGNVSPIQFSTDAPQEIIVTPTSDKCTITLQCKGEVVGKFTMNEVLTVPEYIFGSAETEFTQGTEYELIVQRVTAPIKQTQIEVSCNGGIVSPHFLVDEGFPITFEGANAKILVTPTDKTCVVTLKVNLAGVTYSVGKFTMKANSVTNEIKIFKDDDDD